MTTLISPCRKGAKDPALWDRIWANVPDKNDEDPEYKPELIFPWLAPTRTSKNNEMVTEENSHPALAFFACPRRIRLEFAANVVCDMSGKTGAGAIGLRTQNYGTNYLHWRHPLSPYRTDKKEGLLPLHPHSGPSDYGDWLAWWGGTGKVAKVFDFWQERRDKASLVLNELTSVEAFGFDMDNAKARQWLNASIPWLPPFETGEDAMQRPEQTLQNLVRCCIDAADAAARAVTRSAKLALYGLKSDNFYKLPENRAVTRSAKLALYGLKSDNFYKLPENLAKDALKEPGERLWNETESAFRALLEEFQQRLKNPQAETMDLLNGWQGTLWHQAFRIFDSTVDMDGMTNANPHRVLWARDKLRSEFENVRKALGLTASKPRSVQKSKKKDAA